MAADTAGAGGAAPPAGEPTVGSSLLVASLATSPIEEIPGVRLELRSEFDVTPETASSVRDIDLLPAVVDAVRIPVVATGGIADERGVAAALILGASAAQIGTGFLRCPEAKTHSAWANALAVTPPEGTIVSRVFSGRAGRSILTDYVKAAISPDAPAPAPYPVQRGLTSALRESGGKSGDAHRMQVWAGQSAAMARTDPADEIVRRVWQGAQALLA
jgi:nitronate monooxygenase